MEKRSYRVLLVEDSPEDRATYERLLSHGGGDAYEFLEDETAEEAVELCRAQRPDCVLLDYRLPDADGLDVLAQLTNGDAESAVPIVMLTGRGNEAVAVQALQGGAQDYLIKGGVTAQALRWAIHNAMEKVALRRQIERQRRELERLATTDVLTGVFNRRVLLERLELELRRCRRYGSRLCVLLLDVDHFKRINDAYGHLAGDGVLVTLGHILRTRVRGTDVTGRYGGEEFCVLLPETDLEPGRELAERLRQHVAAEAFTAGATTFRVTCSVGVAHFTDARQKVADLLQAADKALYRAKELGRDRVCVAGLQSACS
jgi:two-component system cell cycle response regulator